MAIPVAYYCIATFSVIFVFLVIVITVRPPDNSASDSKNPLIKNSSVENFNAPSVPISPNIVGGSDAYDGEFPYQVAVQTRNDDKQPWESICGGSIITPRVIISAAHCIDQGGPYFRIIAGRRDFSKDYEEGQQVRIVEEIYKRSDWDSATYNNDIAAFILYKTEPLVFDDKNVKPIRLPPHNHIPRGIGVISGWGSNQVSRRHSKSMMVLQKLEIPIHDYSTCKGIYGDDLYPSMLCAGILRGGGDACTGDSGGPLAASDLGYPYLAGVVSSGVGCARPNYPGIYSKVSLYTKWIESLIQQNT